MGQHEHILAQCEAGDIVATENLRTGDVTLRYCRELSGGKSLEEAWDGLLAMQEDGKAPGHEWDYQYDPCGQSWERCTRCGRTRRLGR